MDRSLPTQTLTPSTAPTSPPAPTSASQVTAPASPLAAAPSAKTAFDKFRPQALQLPNERIIVFRADATLAYHNVRRGVDNVLPERSRVEEELPRVNFLHIVELPELAQAVVFANLQTDIDVRSSGLIAALLKEGAPLRRKLLGAAVVLAGDGLLSGDEVRAIQKGRGKLAQAHDLVRLGAMFERNWLQLVDKTSVTPEEVARALNLGSQLETLIRPRGAARPRKLAPGQLEWVEMRNRLWSLLVERHTILWKVGAWLWGRDVEDYVPALKSRVVDRADEGEDEGEDETPAS